MMIDEVGHTPTLADRPSAYLTIQDLMRRYRISRPTVWDWRRRGLLPQGIRFGALVRFPAEEIAEFEQRAAERRGAR